MINELDVEKFVKNYIEYFEYRKLHKVDENFEWSPCEEVMRKLIFFNDSPYSKVFDFEWNKFNENQKLLISELYSSLYKSKFILFSSKRNNLPHKEPISLKKMFLKNYEKEEIYFNYVKQEEFISIFKKILNIILETRNGFTIDINGKNEIIDITSEELWKYIKNIEPEIKKLKKKVGDNKKEIAKLNIKQEIIVEKLNSLDEEKKGSNDNEKIKKLTKEILEEVVEIIPFSNKMKSLAIIGYKGYNFYKEGYRLAKESYRFSKEGYRLTKKSYKHTKNLLSKKTKKP